MTAGSARAYQFHRAPFALHEFTLPPDSNDVNVTPDKRTVMLHEEMRYFYNGFPRDAHPMAILSSVVSALSTFYQDSLDPFDAEHVEMSTVRLMAKVPTIASYAYKKAIGQPLPMTVHRRGANRIAVLPPPASWRR